LLLQGYGRRCSGRQEEKKSPVVFFSVGRGTKCFRTPLSESETPLETSEAEGAKVESVETVESIEKR
jgi:hypothetical protein